MQQVKYKVGQTVVCLPEREDEIDIGFEPNLEFKITDINKYKDCDVLFGGKDGGGVLSFNVRPKYVVVERDKDNPLWEGFVEWLRDTYRQNYSVDGFLYYGYDGNPHYSGTNCYDDLKHFQNNPTLLTLEQWKSLFKPENKQENTNDMSSPSDLIPMGFPDGEQRITVGKVSAEYLQEADDTSTDIQSLEISTEDGGGGTYFLLKTERWAFDSIDDLVNILNDFKKRINDEDDKQQGEKLPFYLL